MATRCNWARIVLIASTLFAGSAMAAELDSGNANVLAREAAGQGAPVPLSGVATWEIRSRLGYAMSSNESRNGRIDCRNIQFDPARLSLTTVGAVSTTQGMTLVHNGPGGVDGGIVFSLSGTGHGQASDEVHVRISTAGGLTLKHLADAECSFTLYEFPSNALAGGGTGIIYTTGMRPYLRLANALSITTDPGVLMVDYVGPAPYPAFSRFKSATPPAAMPETWKGAVGTVTFGTESPVYKPDGQVTTVADIYGTTSKLWLLGEVGAGPGFSVLLGAEPRCATPLATMDAATKTMTLATTPLSGLYYLCYHVPGDAVIPDGDWRVLLVTPSGYASEQMPVGRIRKEGVELQATVAESHPDYVTRIVLSNDAHAELPYTIRVVDEQGASTFIDSGLQTGVLPAKGIRTIDISKLLPSVGGLKRTTIIIAINTNASGAWAIKGMYQLTHKLSGAVSNTPLVRVESAAGVF